MGREFPGYEGGLKPEFRFLSDKAVIIQAWKKAHEYMRRHNWYSDNLELDLSCINLEELYLEIREEFRDEKDVKYCPLPMRMVPAPKTCDTWGLKKSDFTAPDEFELRPLAHLSVKDQVVSMMMLMCLANIIERRQGVARPYNDLRTPCDVVNYGNRLISSASLDTGEYLGQNALQSEASFLWGNSETYSRYYTDYQNFISRPGEVLEHLKEELANNNNRVYTVSLDLSKFYDRINRQLLISKVRREVSQVGAIDDAFINAFAKTINWSWDQRDEVLVAAYQKTLDDDENGANDWIEGRSGVPQGLASGGFLANVYLLDFDDYIKRLISDKIGIEACGLKFFIHDYCRYVDDMRLVVSAQSEAEIAGVAQKEFVDSLQKILTLKCPGQRFSAKKIFWDEYVCDSQMDFVSFRMSESKRIASGVMDEHSACELLELNRALWSEDGADTEASDGGVVDRIRRPRSRSRIKGDRVERFAANNWRRAYRALTGMLPDQEYFPDDGDNNSCMSVRVLNALTDEFCEDVIIRWLSDPSKVRILRIALDLRPRVKYIDVIFDALIGLIHESGYSRDCGCYVLAELYRAAVIETGYAYSDEDSVMHNEWMAYRSCLHKYVSKFAKEDVPWYVANQMMLFELTYGTPDSLSLMRVKSLCDPIYWHCWSLMTEGNQDGQVDEMSVSTVILAHKITGSDLVLRNGKQVVLNAMNGEGHNACKCKAFLPLKYLTSVLRGSDGINPMPTREFDLRKNEWMNLREIVFSGNNPFQNEISLCRLGIALCSFIANQKISFRRFFTLSDIEVSCTDWNRISCIQQDQIEVKVRKSTTGIDFGSVSCMFMPEPWETKSFMKLAQVGRILRAVAMSGDEYCAMRREPLTIPSHSEEENRGRFFGVRSSWLKRKYGIYFDRACLGGVHVAFSPWFTDLFSALLAWPGSFVNSKYERITFSKLKSILNRRLTDLARFDLEVPDTLLIPVDINLNKFNNGTQKVINVAVVQNLYPDEKCLSNAAQRESLVVKRKARRHLSDMLDMLEKTFVTHKAMMAVGKSINLVVFPELAIHLKNVDLLRRFADRMNCMIFCGLVYCKDPENENHLINAGLWLIPQRRDQHDRRVFIELLQGKKNIARAENSNPRLHGYRPVQWIIRGLPKENAKPIWSLSASICYDATDIRLAAALRDHIDCYIVSAFNQDVGLFDTMAESWRYHMYSHTVLANTGVFGGSTIQAPYSIPHDRIIAHIHGADQAQILLATLDLSKFEKKFERNCSGGKKDRHTQKTSPAGYNGRIR